MVIYSFGHLLNHAPLINIQHTINTAMRLSSFPICHIPSSIVLSTSTELFGPSPSEVKANTLNSYSVYLSSQVTFLLNVDPLLIVKVVADPPEPFFL